MTTFPVVMRAHKTLEEGGKYLPFELELRVARQTSVLMARRVGEGADAWRTWGSWDTPQDDPVGVGMREAARYGADGWAPVPRPPLTAPDVVSLAAIVDAATRGATVARVVEVGDGVVWGTARHIVTDDRTAAFPGAADDVRDCLLRVTLASGMEAFWPVAGLVSDHQTGMFVTDYRP